jgi:O-antigen/teichoic acid export membrane protein
MPQVDNLSPSLPLTSLRRTEEKKGGCVSSFLARAQRWRSVRNVATLSVGTALSQGLSVLAAPILTRLFTPSDIGLLGLFASFLSTAAVAAALKYELGIVSTVDDSEAAQLTYASTLLSFPTGLVSGVALYFCIRHAWFGFGALPLYAAWMMSAAVFLIGVFSALRYWALRDGRFALLSKTSISQGAARSVSQTVLGFWHAGIAVLLIGELFSRAVGIAPLVREGWSRIRDLVRRASTRDLLTPLQRNRKLAIYSLPSSLIDTLLCNIPLPLVVALYGSESGGYFAVVQKVLAIPLALIASSVADTFHNELAICAREEPEAMYRLFKRTSKALFLIGLVPATVLLFWGKPLFQILFGAGWETAGTLAAICTPWFLTQFVTSPLSRLVVVLRGQEFKLIYDLVLLIGVGLVIEFARYRSFTLWQTVCALSVVNSIAYVIYYVVLAMIVSKSCSELTLTAAS